MTWVDAIRSCPSMDDPNCPATPRPASSIVASESSLQGGDCTEFNLLQMIRRLQAENHDKDKEHQRVLEEKERAHREKERALAAENEK